VTKIAGKRTREKAKEDLAAKKGKMSTVILGIPGMAYRNGETRFALCNTRTGG